MDAHAAMKMNTTTKINPPLVTLNTSVFEIPSQSMKSFGKHADDSGLQLISMGNNQQSNAGMISLSQASTNDITVYKEQQGETSALTANKKIWTDQVEEEEHDYAEMYLGTNEYAPALLPSTPQSKEASEKYKKSRFLTQHQLLQRGEV